MLMNLHRDPFQGIRRACIASALAFVTCGISHAASPKSKLSADQIAFFEKSIRPVLVDKCYKCHSAKSEKVKGGLLLDTREGIQRGGDSGHGIVPGNLEESLVIKAIRSTDKDEQMPPKEHLPAAVIEAFEQWVRMGAPDPRDGTVKVASAKPDLEAGKNFWSFKPVQQAVPPKVKNTKWPRTEIDRFVLSALESKGMKPVGDSEKGALLRRVYFDLIGLPPKPSEVEAFLADKSPKAFEKVVDTLLTSPQFGERWGRHWLDVARYAESTGRERNYLYTEAWRYRDYVIASFNADKPYDQFIREQVAGDLLPAKNVAQRNEQLVATGFLALGPKGLNEKNREQFLADNVDEQIDATTRAVMAVSVSCARCHDHKFDPITMKDYYAVAGIFRSTENCYGTGEKGAGKNRQPGKLISLATEKSFAAKTGSSSKADRGSALTEEQEKMLQRYAAKNPMAAERLKTMSDEQKLEALSRLQGGNAKKKKTAKYAKKPVEEPADEAGEHAMGVREGRIQEATMYQRGDITESGPEIPRGFVKVLSAANPAPSVPAGESGRLELAQWLTAPQNTLTARVMANRVWQHLMGEGLVASADNFGATGERPTHPELLDYLASRFVAEGWSVKKLIREVVMTRTYQLSSAHDAKNFELDPDNNFLWHANQRRLDAESIRDAALAVGGRLDLKPLNGSPVASLGDIDIGRTRNAMLRSDSTKRSVYLPIVRDMVPDVLDLFDFAEPSLVVANRDVTTVPSQALFMLNSPFIYENSAQMAKNILAEGSMDDRRCIETAYLAALSRQPTAAESARAQSYLSKQSAGGSRETAWTTFCQALLASAEFRYIN